MGRPVIVPFRPAMALSFAWFVAAVAAASVPAPQVAKRVLLPSLGGAASMTLEPDTNRPGEDLRSFPLDVARPEACQEACAQDSQRKAFTWVKPGVQAAMAVCWLRNSVPAATPNAGTASGVLK